MQHLQSYKTILDGSLVVVLTTNSHERKAVLSVLKAKRKLQTNNPSCRAYLGVSADRIVLVLDGDGAFSGMGAASRFLCDFLANGLYPRPAAVIMCGVCWGNPALTSVGDVLVASTLISINRSVANQKGEISIIPRTFETCFPESAVKSLKEVGVVAPAILISEEQLYQGSEARDTQLLGFPHAHGGEMEGFVIAPACQAKSIPWLIIKAVSDFGGDDFERSAQDTAAHQAANVLVKCFEKIIYDESREEELRELADVICGHLFELRQEQFDFGGNIALQVNDKLCGLESVISFYTGSATQSRFLANKLAIVLREFALNAFKHGRARRVRIDVDPQGVSFDDDGDPYTIEQLVAEEKGRGGQLAWTGLKRDCIDAEMLTVRIGARNKWKNGFRFNIENEYPHLVDAKLKCRAEINQSKRPAIYVHPECFDVYVDIRHIEMMTLVLDTVEEFKPLLDEGKKIHVALTDPDIREKIKLAFPIEIESQYLIILDEG